VPFSGAIVQTDSDFNIKQRVDFTQAVFSQATVGALDATQLPRTAADTQFQFKLDVATLKA
jgi:hypothetical protein